MSEQTWIIKLRPQKADMDTHVFPIVLHKNTTFLQSIMSILRFIVHLKQTRDLPSHHCKFTYLPAFGGRWIKHAKLFQVQLDFTNHLMVRNCHHHFLRSFSFHPFFRSRPKKKTSEWNSVTVEFWFIHFVRCISWSICSRKCSKLSYDVWSINHREPQDVPDRWRSSFDLRE